MIILKMFFNIFFIISVYTDIKEKIIPEYCIVTMLLISIIQLIIKQNFSQFYYSISIYCLPFYILIILETYLKKELIGLGDIKLMLVIGAYFSNSNLYFMNMYYTLTYSFGVVYIVLIKNKNDNEYIAFAPMMYLSYLILDFWGIIL